MESCCIWPEAARSAFETADYVVSAGREAKQHPHFWTKNFRAGKAQACDYLQNCTSRRSTLIIIIIEYVDLHKVSNNI